MDIHNRTFHGKDEKYNCDICGFQVSNKISLGRHKKIVHEGVKYHCKQCHYEATSESHIDEHKRAAHEGVKYHCRQCNHKATSKGNLFFFLSIYAAAAAPRFLFHFKDNNSAYLLRGPRGSGKQHH